MKALFTTTQKKVIFAGVFFFFLVFQSCESPISQPPQKVIVTGVEVNFSAMWDKNPIVFLGDYYKNNPSQMSTAQPEYLQFINLGMIISKLSLIKEDGTTVLLGDGYQWIDFKQGRTRFNYEIPKGNYKSLQFTLGLDYDINHGNPNQWGPEHPLNGNLSGMHWGWSGGYIFQAIDGNYKDSTTDKYSKGLSFHTAGDNLKRNFVVSVSNASGSFSVVDGAISKVLLKYQVDQLFNTIELKKGSVSHSEGVKELQLMDKFLSNLTKYNAFRFSSIP
ncbi:MAG: hypothetical protein EXR17_00950 [Flavobacteriaceae bacterium]|nr:hypothetical protein [Flavobacteriaceae bacterium]